MHSMPTLATYPELLQAAESISPFVHNTPIFQSSTLSEMVGCQVFLKAELFQKTGSYKPRGMLWALMQLSDDERAQGVISFSAGNAAQGLAYAASIMDVQSTVVMPASASRMKAQATREYGAEVIQYGTPAECYARSQELAQSKGMTFISSYDNHHLISGHSSMALEVMATVPDVSEIFVGIGGGGMAAGLARAVAATGRDISLFGVEPTAAPAMHRSLEAGAAVAINPEHTIADGLAAPSAGSLCFPLVRDYFSDVLLVDESELANAMRLLMLRCKLFAEPAGSASVAGLLAHKDRFPSDARIVCIVSGGNIDPDRLKTIL